MTGPTTRKRRLGQLLKQLRNNARGGEGITREEAAAEIECSPTKITHLETGHTTPRKAEQLVLLQLYGADEETIAVLEDLRRGASERGWWSTAKLPNWLAAYVGLENDAETVRTWELGLVPGLLQTRGYARVLHAQRGRLSAEQLDHRVNARMQRQKRLDVSEAPLHLTAIVAEAALLHCVNEPRVGGDQLRRLIERAAQPNIELLVLPLTVGLNAGLSGGFSVLTFPNDLLPPVAYQEYALGGHVIDEQNDVSQLDTLFGQLRSQALGADESLAVVAELAENTS